MNLSYYDQARAASEAGGRQPAEILLYDLASDVDLNRRHKDSGTGRAASEVRGWLIPFLDAAMKFVANVTETPLRDLLLFYWCDRCAISGVSGQFSG